MEKNMCCKKKKKQLRKIQVIYMNKEVTTSVKTYDVPEGGTAIEQIDGGLKIFDYNGDLVTFIEQQEEFIQRYRFCYKMV